MSDPPYRIDAIYPVHLDWDDLLIEAAGYPPQSRGCGDGGRDLNWFTWTISERDALAKRLNGLGLSLLAVVRRTDLDPLERRADG